MRCGGGGGGGSGGFAAVASIVGGGRRPEHPAGPDQARHGAPTIGSGKAALERRRDGRVTEALEEGGDELLRREDGIPPLSPPLPMMMVPRHRRGSSQFVDEGG